MDFMTNKEYLQVANSPMLWICVIPVVIVEEDRLYLNFINDNVVQAQADVASGVHPVSEYRGADRLYMQLLRMRDSF